MGPIVVSCEHASNAVPAGVDLGVDADVLASHVAWDPGAQEIAQYVADALGAPCFFGEASRLVADLNRGVDNVEVVPPVAFETPVPGNQDLSAEQRQQRIQQFHRPYCDAVEAAVRERLGEQPVLHLSIHSFSPHYGQEERPMSFGLMYDPARPLENALTGRLAPALSNLGWSWGDNLPYDGREDALVTQLRKVFDATRYVGYGVEHNQRHLHELDAMADVLVRAIKVAWVG